MAAQHDRDTVVALFCPGCS